MSSLSALRTRLGRKFPGGNTSEFPNDSIKNEALNRAREFMYTRFNWPHLIVEDVLVFTSGSTTLPSDFKDYVSLRNRAGSTHFIKVSPDDFDTSSSNTWTIKSMAASSRTIAASPSGLSRVSNVVTLTTTAAHPYEVGDSITLASTTSVGATSFDGTFTVATVPTTTTLTFAQTAADDTGGAGTVQRTDGQRRVYIKPAGTTEAIMRYFRILTDLSDDADDSLFPVELEEAMLYGAMKFIAEADRDGEFVGYWEKEFFDYVKAVHSDQVMMDGGYENNQIQSIYQYTTLLNQP